LPADADGHDDRAADDSTKPADTRDSTMTDWHTDLEKNLIEDRGGTHKEQYGPDGVLPDGDPVEVRLAKTEDRFRLNQDTHEELVEDDGAYIFDDVADNQPPTEVEADRVDDLLDEDWHSDRGYMHQFIDVDSIF
jgi:hypothetical protein